MERFVRLGSGVAAIATEGSHTCALTTGGAVLCWGLNVLGQVGDGTSARRSSTTTASSAPVAVSGLFGSPVAVAAGGVHTCALLAGGAVQCWGANTRGDLGDGTTTSSCLPVLVSGFASLVPALPAPMAGLLAVVLGAMRPRSASPS